VSLRLDRLELREVHMRLKSPFRTSLGVTTHRRILVVRVFDSDGATGYGECVAAEDPFYSPETVDTAWIIAIHYVAPALAAAAVSRARDVRDALAPIRGNRMAIGGVEAAVWDLEAKRAGVALWRHIGGTRAEIACGVSIGLQETTEALLDRVRRELDSGYQRIKIKIEPGRDVDLVRAVRAEFPDATLSVDANSAYALASDAAVLEALDDWGLLMIEQPLAAGDLVDHAALQRRLATPICLDESIERPSDVRHAHELGSCRIVNVKLGRVGGFSDAIAIETFAREHAMPVWCGGMLESGVGRAHNIALSTLEGFTLPGDVSASARYWDEEIIEPPVTVSAEGTIRAPEGPGIGFEVDERRVEALTVRRQVVPLR
jgi:O-succinylbenzoate synthase